MRIRTIKPDFWTDEKIVELPFEGRLLFIGLLNIADDEGRMEYSPKKIKMLLFPNDTLEIEPLIDLLEKNGMILLYPKEKPKHLQVVNFLKHQKNLKSESSFPSPPAGEFVVNNFPDNSGKLLQEGKVKEMEKNGNEIKGIPEEGKEGNPLQLLKEKVLKIFSFDWEEIINQAKKSFSYSDEQLSIILLKWLNNRTANKWQTGGGRKITHKNVVNDIVNWIANERKNDKASDKEKSFKSVNEEIEEMKNKLTIKKGK